jgi:hypothetical protein
MERGEVITTQWELMKEQGLKNMNEARKAAREREQTRGSGSWTNDPTRD